MTKARFSTLSARTTDKELWIQDVGPWHIHPTITNDAEGVVDHLYRCRALANGRRLFYLDSEGEPAELKHDGAGKFLGFAPYLEVAP